MNEKQNLYFIAIVPPEKICIEVTGFKEDFANRFQSRTALKVVPHITLKAPFKCPAVDHVETIQWFEQMPVTVSPFQQKLTNFGAFHNKRNPVVFVNPVMNRSLDILQKEVLLHFKKSYPQESIMELELKYNPHMTIAYRDLQPQMFKEAWKEYQTKKYESCFEVSDFHLFQHDSRKWNKISTVQLQ